MIGILGPIVAPEPLSFVQESVNYETGRISDRFAIPPALKY